MDIETIEDEDLRDGYGKAVGERLRHIRRQKRLSLQEVESISGQEFKASVLGAYERGERAISVPRLQRLAKFYKVPVDQLLPDLDGEELDLVREHWAGGSMRAVRRMIETIVAGREAFAARH